MQKISLLLLLIPFQLFSQNIEISEHSDFRPTEELTNTLNILANDSILDKLKFVAKIKGYDSEIPKLYWAMHNATTSEGANIYKLSSFKIDAKNQMYYCEWEIYYGSDSIQELNFLSNNSNVIYVFANSKPISNFKVNGKKQSLKPMEYYSYP